MLIMKEALWNECLKNNIFEGFSESELPNIQSVFEETYEENRDIQPADFMYVLSKKLKQQKKFEYKDLIPENKPSIIDFSDKSEEEPIVDIDRLISEKEKEREILYKTNETSTTNIPSNQVVPQHVESHSVPNVAVDHEQHYKYQNKILEQILESQIKILKYLQKK
ncbi:hypothetical protein 162313617 [Organic Lake phycodnavirus 1]|nr:hypothetical protein 162322592 [Organic Lake phycodnavirus 1]ADX06058.1 hypothetical protein 162313617 [Organic Lake phycodnavirus 1]